VEAIFPELMAKNKHKQLKTNESSCCSGNIMEIYPIRVSENGVPWYFPQKAINKYRKS
jgi:hypothetical protein